MLCVSDDRDADTYLNRPRVAKGDWSNFFKATTAKNGPYGTDLALLHRADIYHAFKIATTVRESSVIGK